MCAEIRHLGSLKAYSIWSMASAASPVPRFPPIWTLIRLVQVFPLDVSLKVSDRLLSLAPPSPVDRLPSQPLNLTSNLSRSSWAERVQT